MFDRKYIYLWILIASILLTPPLSRAHADNEASVLQVYIAEQKMTVFVDAELRSDGLTCLVSNQSTEILATGLLSDENALKKTTILIDVSTSMPRSARNVIITALNKMVELKSPSEEYRLVVFGDELNTIHDFTADRYDLANAIEKIGFDGTQSRIYDAIFNTIPSIEPSDGKPTFHRTIVITDGIDNTASGITREELFFRLQNERYPIDVVAVSGREAAENRELSAIVRMSGGRYFSLNPSTDSAALAQALGVSGYFYFEAIVPSALLDGTTRQVDISDGAKGVSIDVRFPVWGTPGDNIALPSSTPTEPEQNETAAVSPEPAVTSEAVTPSPLAATDATESFDNNSGDYSVVIFIGAGVALIIIIAIVVAIVIIRRKKKKPAQHIESISEEQTQADIFIKPTDIIIGTDYADIQFTIKLSSANDPSKTWTLPISGDLLIGRAEHCPIQLDEKSVSREQCKIAVQGDRLVVANLGTTNKTLLNGTCVVEPTPLNSGDTLKFGREELRIDYIQTLGNPPPKSEQPQTTKNGNTEPLFFGKRDA